MIDSDGRVPEVVECPGHTPGSVSFLDRQSQILFSGDACNQNTLVARGGAPALMDAEDERNTVGALARTARRLRDLRDEGAFVANYNGHVGYVRSFAFVPQHPAVIDECVELADAILAGTARTLVRPNFDASADVLVASTQHVTIQFGPWQVR